MSILNKNRRVSMLLRAAGTLLSIVATAADRAEVVYGVDSNDDSLYTLDLSTGTTTIIGPLHGDPARYTTPVAMAVRPSDGQIFVWNNSPAGDGGLSIVDPATGGATLLGGPVIRQAVAFDGNARLRAISGGALITINQSTGAAMGGVGAGLPVVHGLDFNPNDGFLYGIDPNPAAPQIYRIDPCRGTLVATIGLSMALTGSATGSLLFDSSGTLHGTTNGAVDNLFEIDPATGVVSNLRTCTSSPQGLGLVPQSACGGADIDHDGTVGFNDLLLVLTNWGPCP
jgi:hypothetical protein